jgi:mutator protein MutT
MKEKKHAVTALIYNEHGEILAVSRKDNHLDFGLPGGKVEPGESLEETLKREVAEETGLVVTQCRSYFTREDGEYISTTFLCNYHGDIRTTEAGVVKWTNFDEIKKGSFGSYNTLLEAHVKTIPKYVKGDLLLNPETGEAFQIYDRLGWESGFPSYIVRTLFTENKFLVIRASAFDLRMDFIDLGEFMTRSINMTDAEKFAFGSHLDTLHYYDDFLYSYHLHGVRKVGRRYKHLIPDEEWDDVEGGLLCHDTIEDARRTLNDVEKTLNKNVANGVYALTNEKGRNRDGRANKKYYDEMILVKNAEFMKLCDRIFNIESGLRTGNSMVSKYRKEHQKFKESVWNENSVNLIEMWNHLELLLGFKQLA